MVSEKKTKEEIEAFDKNGDELKIGSIVIYPNTATTGTVTEIMKDDEGTWAFIDTTKLFYRTEQLEKIDQLPEKEIRKRDFEKDIKEKLDIHKEAVQAFTLENVGEPGGAG
ncbi:MAG: DUF2098 domain-containing protein [Methanosarcinaceae archaeon]|nr:DUF2098 domain-containing protein [Methanosarcinaceae archaeon]